MRFFKLFLAGVISLVVNVQALSLPASLNSPQVSQNIAHVTAANTNQVSRNWSGYAATNGAFTGASATWQIPQSSTRNFGIDATWVGIGGVNNDDLIQAGTQTIAQPNGQTQYEAFWETLPDPSQPIGLDVNGGDSISASVTKIGDSTWQIAISNDTTGQKKQFSLHYSSSLSSADWIEEAPSGERNVLPLDNFGTVHFSSVVAIENGEKVTLSQAHAQAMHMGADMGEVLAVTSVVGSDGQSFSVSRTTASTDEIAPKRNHLRGYSAF